MKKFNTVKKLEDYARETVQANWSDENIEIKQLDENRALIIIGRTSITLNINGRSPSIFIGGGEMQGIESAIFIRDNINKAIAIADWFEKDN